MRTVNQTLLDAIANQTGETIIRVKTWADLTAYNAAPTVPEKTWTCEGFDILATSANATIITDNLYTESNFTVFIIERGVTLSSTEYVVQSGIYFVREYEEEPGRIKLKGSSYPYLKIVIDGDQTYEEVINDFCTEIGKTAVFKDDSEAWLGYNFLPTGKQVVLNKAERFENLLRQKYGILIYERSPKELVFYSANEPQSAWKAIHYSAELDSSIIVASSGDHETALTTDGLAWQKNSAPSFTNALAYSPTLDLFVAVGNGIALSSPDGETWTERTITPYNWTGVIWDSTLAKFIAVANGATALSTNGTAWTTTYQNTYDFAWTSRTATASQWTSVCYSPELNLFVAVANGTDTIPSIMTSPDGTTWTDRDDEKTLNAVAWSPELELFAAVGPSITYTSPDGVTWTSRTVPASTWLSICWSPELTLFVAVGNGVVMTSPDGITWTSRTPSQSNLWNSVTWSAELTLFVAVAQNGTNRVMTSPDGETWTNRSASEANTWNSVCWSSELTLFVAVAQDGTNRVMTSPDGTTWTNRSAATVSTWNEVCWSPNLTLFMAIAGNGNVMSSPDGTTWTDRTEAASNNWTGICWSSEQGLFVTVADETIDSPRVMTSDAIYKSFIAITTNNTTITAVGIDIARTSTNGTAWTDRTIDTGTYNAVHYADSLFVAVGTSSVCATSPDGVTWTARTIPTGTYRAIHYSDTLDLFAAVGDDGIIATSPDAITWTQRTSPLANDWQGITWDTNQFITVSSDGENRIAISTDGITWLIQTSQADFSLTYLDGKKHRVQHGLSAVHYLWRDEVATLHTSGDTDLPQWNLGYLESTDSPPTTSADPFYKFYLQKAPIRLDITDGDRIHFDPLWELDPTKTIDAQVLVTEHLNLQKDPPWYQDITSIALFESVEGGSLPSTIERVAAYTPLSTSSFDNNLDSTVNNLQALAEAVDELAVGSSDEEIQDLIGGMINTQTGITVSYDDPTGKLNFVTEVTQSELDTTNTNISNHLADTDDAHDASTISYAGGTGMSATNVESAIDELATEKTNTDGWTPDSNTWTFYNRTQAYTNDPAAGEGIVLNMTNTAGFIVGSDVTVSSSAGNEDTYVTAVVTNTSITVHYLALNHTTSNRLVTLLDVFYIAGDQTAVIKKGAMLKWTQTTVKYGTVFSSTYDSTNTYIVLIHNTDYALTNAAISSTYYSYFAYPSGWPGWFNYNAQPLGYTLGALPTSTTYKFRPLGNSLTFNITQLNPGTSNATINETAAPCVFTITIGAPNITTVDNGVINLTNAARSQTLLNTRRIIHRTDMNTGAWTAANGKRCNVFFGNVEF